ncbi:hypothetical protein AVEN_104406-1 [Araneus ventricosus]|uniref:RNase H type-1 domain-containing protein n=1 Tax=Araneus ventricosus TaxID=182803 RepID=A0A4Y2VZJ9_ARAVE|nr:hypothetical protein AVEN_68230-1 [Araneus ventricosus]GBO29320.1 hypothetical protein AVEN_104406-1 [Araneus ventricosus]
MQENVFICFKKWSRINDGLRQFEDYETRLDPHNIHPADNISITYDKHKPSGEEIEIYTDGSKINDQVGAAIVVFYYNAEIFNRTIRLSDFATVYQAEVTGIQMALEFISTIGPWNKINLYTDSLSVFEALNTFKTKFRADQVCGSMKLRHLNCRAHFGDPPDGSIDVRESVYMYMYKEKIVREHLTGSQHYPDHGLVSGTRGEVSRNQEEACTNL